MEVAAVGEVQFFYSGWESMARILLVGTLGFLWLLFLVRIAGPRTLGTMTAFDFLITVTLGSAFGRVLTAEEVAVTDMLVAFALLVGLRWSLAAVRFRRPGFGRIVDTTPTLVFHHGEVVERALRRQRLSPTDLETAAREQGQGSLADVASIVLEQDGSFSVVPYSTAGDGSAMRGLLDGLTAPPEDGDRRPGR
jgi:uncharacterized membrane protein YcaP (DUF421 family)